MQRPFPRPIIIPGFTRIVVGPAFSGLVLSGAVGARGQGLMPPSVHPLESGLCATAPAAWAASVIVSPSEATIVAEPSATDRDLSISFLRVSEVPMRRALGTSAKVSRFRTRFAHTRNTVLPVDLRKPHEHVVACCCALGVREPPFSFSLCRSRETDRYCAAMASPSRSTTRSCSSNCLASARRCAFAMVSDDAHSALGRDLEPKPARSRITAK